MRNRASLRKIPQPIPVHQPLNLQGPGVSSEPSADVTAGQPGAASGSQGADMVTRGAGLAASTETGQSNAGSEFNAGSMSPDRACDLVMQAATGMENPGILGVLRKPLVPEPGKFADVGESRVQVEQGGRAGTQPVQGRALVGLEVS